VSAGTAAEDGGEGGGVARRDLVQSLGRGLAVIRSFAEGGPEMTLSEVAERAGVTRAAARRFLLTLAELGYVHTDGKHFSLRPTILELGNAYLSGTGLGDVARPHMERLVERVEDSSALCVRSGDDIAYVALARVPARRMSLNVSIGTLVPAYPTSMGRILLAAQPAEWRAAYLARAELRQLTPYTVTDPVKVGAILDRVAKDGFAIVDQELDVGLRSVAVAVHGLDGGVLGALNVSTFVARRSVEDLRTELLDQLRITAREIEADLAAIGRRRSGMGFERP
jgi:IclR family transcriptional regulator, pca regulon regulatory protein